MEARCVSWERAVDLLPAGARMDVWVYDECREPSKLRKSEGKSSEEGGSRAIERAISASRRSHTRLVGFLNDKENVDPGGAVRGRSASRSPLPPWYPRLPLQDITSMVNAFQSMQIDGGSKLPKPKLDSCGSSAPVAFSGANRSGFTKSWNERPALPVSSHARSKKCALRKHFR